MKEDRTAHRRRQDAGCLGNMDMECWLWGSLRPASFGNTGRRLAAEIQAGSASQEAMGIDGAKKDAVSDYDHLH